MTTLFKIVQELTPLSRVFCAPDYDRAIEYVSTLLPFKVHAYSSESTPVLGWIIPPSWRVVEAYISFRGQRILDATHHPLSVILLSSEFHGTVSRDVLVKHLHCHALHADAIPFHFRQQYRPWDRDWGFCVPRTFLDSLEEGLYDVHVETDEKPGILKVVEYTHVGSSPMCFAFVAHLDHPGMANDDAAGCAVGIEMMRRLQGQKTKFTYKLLLVPELTGSVYYWEKTNKGNSASIVESIYLEMLGSRTQLALQASQRGDTLIEQAVSESLRSMQIEHRLGPPKSIITNDEAVWESYGIQMGSLTRFPYPEYHSSKDNLGIISEESLEEATRVMMTAINHLEQMTVVQRSFSGLVCLSNPEYALHIDGDQVSFGEQVAERSRGLRDLMEAMPTLEGAHSTATLARRFRLSVAEVEDYLQKWALKGLIEMI